jgi:uncharacterized membrane protein YphA (DoxX/SURF4 family)
MSKVKHVALWVLQILLAVMFLGVGIGKVLHGAQWIEKFRLWGYPENFYLVIAATEVFGAIGLLGPRLSGYAAGTLAVVMIGAFVTHLLHSEFPNLVPTGLFTLLLAIVAYQRRPDFVRKSPAKSQAASA